MSLLPYFTVKNIKHLQWVYNDNKLFKDTFRVITILEKLSKLKNRNQKKIYFQTFDDQRFCYLNWWVVECCNSTFTNKCVRLLNSSYHKCAATLRFLWHQQLLIIYMSRCEMQLSQRLVSQTSGHSGFEPNRPPWTRPTEATLQNRDRPPLHVLVLHHLGPIV